MSILPEEKAIEPIGVDRRLTNIKVPKDVADLLRIYCIFNKKKVTEHATSVLRKELEGFKRRLDTIKQFKGGY